MDKFWKYADRHWDDMLTCLLEHIQMCSIAIGISLLIAIPLCVILMKRKSVSKLVVALLGACYAIPSMAFFAILLPVFGLGKTGAIFVLTVYSQFILTKNILAAFQGIDPLMLESAKGMGMSTPQVFFKVQMPLALPVILSGIRIAAIATISSATIAQTINAGGIGKILFEGLRTNNVVKMIWGTILAAFLALTVNFILESLEKIALKKARGEYVKKKR